jgi:hypothetical protein
VIGWLASIVLKTAGQQGIILNVGELSTAASRWQRRAVLAYASFALAGMLIAHLFRTAPRANLFERESGLDAMGFGQFLPRADPFLRSP